ncbi:MAG: type IV pilus modification protein PilV [Methylococcales bacterium]|nr:type IV pilus modification protein PilV [Methylococcales bacterium]MBT7444285.1 type IV pilus modification protein PilV [Methylococcales bacterium]
MKNNTFPRKLHEGFTLIEVLIAVIVLSIGLLGFAGLQLSSLRNTNSSYTRAQAVTLSYDIVDRMRANIVGFHCGLYGFDGKNQNTMPPTESLTLETGIKDCGSVDGTIGGIAKGDIKEWSERITSDSEFPDAEGLVTCQSADLAGFPDSVRKQFPTLSCTGADLQYVVALKWKEASRDYKADAKEAVKVLAVATGFRP